MLTMKTLRKTHVYLGCLFVPMIFMYSLSGLWQLLEFHDLPYLSNITSWHTQRPLKQGTSFTGPAVASLGVLFSISLMTMTALGVRMAISIDKRKRMVIWLLVLGVVVPIAAALISMN